MNKILIILAACALSMTAAAQQTKLEGSWVQLDGDGRPTTQVKTFLPNGRQIGLSYNKDFTSHSVWFMSNYKVLNDTTYIDHAFYHSDINYQRDYYFTFHLENDSLMTTSYLNYWPNGLEINLVERWKRISNRMTCDDAEWEAMYQKSLAEFDRLPKEGQTVEQYAKELYAKAQDFKKTNRLDRASEALLMRAELDTTNLEWQKDIYFLYLENRMAPSVAEKIADRYIRLKEAQAPSANDTSVVNAYRTKIYLYNYRGNPAMPKVREAASKVIAMETAAGYQPSKDYGLDYYLMAESYLPEGNFEAILDYTLKAIDILEKAPDVSKAQLGEAYMLQGVCLMNTDRDREAIDVMLNKTVPHYVDEKGQPLDKLTTMTYPVVLTCYESLLEDNPKDKKLLKEYQEFLSDKLIMAVFRSTDKERNLFGEYIVVERGTWTIEKPTAIPDSTHFLLQKDDKYVDFFKKEGEKTNAEMVVMPVDAAKKQDVIKQWKAYKKAKAK